MALLPVADALAKVLAEAEALAQERVMLTDAHERVLARDLKATRTQPPADVSAMDGYAVRARDVTNVPVTLNVVGEVTAGHPFDGTIGANEAARIFTGGVLPQGSDAIVIQENTTRDGDRVTVRNTVAAGTFVRHAGFDFSAGDVLLQKGRVLSGRDLTLAAAMNHPKLSVYRRPAVAIFGTGDELVPVGVEPGEGQIVSSNNYEIAALARREGAEVIDLGIVPDDMEQTAQAIREARERGADILVTTGGASVGDYDLVQKALEAEGLKLSFWKVAMRPGKPLMHGRLGPMHVLGLPGNPVSAFVCSFLFLVPLIRKLSGRIDLILPADQARLGRDLPANDERQDYLRASLSHENDESVATPFPAQDSSLMALLANADCLVVREPHAPPARKGETCRVLRLPR